MQLRTPYFPISLALLSSVAYSSQPLGFTTTAATKRKYGPVSSIYFKADTERQASLLEDMTHVKLQTWNPLATRRSTSLFSSSNEQAIRLPNVSAMSSDATIPYDLGAFQRKNASRKRFGAPPITPDEFIKIEEEVRAMDAINKKKAAYITEQTAQQKPKKKEESFVNSIFGGVLKNGCESNFDCNRPQVCCDVGVKKICCSSGLGIVDGIPVERYERALLRVPMPNDDLDRRS